ncbi:transcription termination/antitermination factor NusG [Prosthecochloris sp. GSB1]|uniref:transcription termination/antitermination protein NusG n=1 Tax=Prosthecochloris sp. GSB1 TaxID=281093 RepID=UPI000B8C94EB|nr:transcription termination/antitermination protein NusG [Prosthecochloris sp. GSB1]ASQ89761.1 transcription termination/antitermination factor NusG [Prosthecochloris sp. GSB1]
MKTGDKEAGQEAQGLPKPRWYALRIYSGHERKVKEGIELEVERQGIEDKILQVYVPYERFVEVKNGKKRSLTKNAFPGYVLIEAVLDKQTKNLIMDIPSVIGFLGVGDVPTPLRPDEVDKILEPEGAVEQRTVVEAPFRLGDSVKVIDGPFSSLTGVVHDVCTERMKVKVMINFFGRSTPTELDFSQVKLVSQ